MANKLNLIGRAKAACAVAGVGSLVFMSLVIFTANNVAPMMDWGACVGFVT